MSISGAGGAVRPVTPAITIGKKQTRKTMMIFEPAPKPTHIRSRGAIAIFGID